MSKTTLRNLLFTLGFCLSSVIVFGVVLFQVQEQGSQLKGYLEVIKKEQVAEQNRRQRELITADTVVERAQLKGYFLARESDIGNFLSHVEDLAAEFDLPLESIIPSTKTINEQTWIETGFVFSGKEREVKQFVSILETLPYVITITQLTLTQETEQGTWRAEVRLLVRVI